jgi:hypothetical protein
LQDLVVFDRVGNMKVKVQKQLDQGLELEKELYAWDQVSDEALLNMERLLLLHGIRGMGKGRKTDLVNELEIIRGEWDREVM